MTDTTDEHTLTPEARLAESLSGSDSAGSASAVFAAKLDGPAINDIEAEADAFHEAAKSESVPETLGAENEDPAVAEIRVDAD